jgi:four helix bundle protein
MLRFTRLDVWKRSHRLAVQIYQLTKPFPRSERFELTSQLHRAAISVPANIAEGSKKRSAADYARYLNIAEGSIAETEALLRLSVSLGLANKIDVIPLVREINSIAEMLFALRRKVEADA